ncbi:MAG: ribosome maturation factor RimP [Clostridia bacterium]|nr:ribosome maturation factor RimP [Clostridia bacterium]
MSFKPRQEIEEFLKKYADRLGLEIVEVETDAKENSITVYIDCEGGVDLDTCEKFHNEIMDPIDELDPSEGAPYTLNVSSPGLDRPFRTARDFEKNKGGDVEIRLYAPYRGKKFLEGVLIDFDDNSVTVKIGRDTAKIELNRIAKISKAIKFE